MFYDSRTKSKDGTTMEGNIINLKEIDWSYFVENWLILSIVCLVVLAIIVYFLIKVIKRRKKKMENKDIFDLPSFEAGEKNEINKRLGNSVVDINKDNIALKNALKEHYNKMIQKRDEIKQYVGSLHTEYEKLDVNIKAMEKVINII